MNGEVKLFQISAHEMPEDYSLVVGVVWTDDFRTGKVTLGRPPIEIPQSALDALGMSLIRSDEDQ
jgi:hypothetical protein